MVASMGPRFCKRGNTLRLTLGGARDVVASMGPRFCKRGNSGKMRPALLIRQLQWGHAFVSVETTWTDVRRANIQIKLQWGHAFVSVETKHGQ